MTEPQIERIKNVHGVYFHTRCSDTKAHGDIATRGTSIALKSSAALTPTACSSLEYSVCCAMSHGTRQGHDDGIRLN